MLISTSDKNITSSLQNALFFCQPDKDSLWTFDKIPILSEDKIDSFKHMNFIEISTSILDILINQEQILIPINDLQTIIKNAYNFPINIHSVSDNIFFLELTHGNTLTFKDFGARILASLILYFKKDDSKLRVLVATSGDTGSAIADAFYQVKNIECHILFPKNKISPIQKQQITSYGKNIFCYETENDFDDCQSWVKQIFDDITINYQLNITSANSINIGRLLGQISYYFYAYSRICNSRKEPFIVSIPSGNLGNLTGAIISMRMGLPIYKIIAACNSNGSLINYLETGSINTNICEYTYSNAMDIVKPSNLKRVTHFFNNLYYELKTSVASINITNQDTLNNILEVYQKYNYIICPHTAIGYAGYKYIDNLYPELRAKYLIVCTSNPIKFKEIIAKVLPNETIPIPIQLKPFLDKKTIFESIPNDYNYFKTVFLNNCNT